MKTGRSLSQEAELRLERSFDADDMMVQMARVIREEWGDRSRPLEIEIHPKRKRRAK